MIPQVSAAAAASEEVLSRAAAISAAVESEARLREVQAGLREQEEQANDAVKVRTACTHCYHCHRAWSQEHSWRHTSQVLMNCCAVTHPKQV